MTHDFIRDNSDTQQSSSPTSLSENTVRLIDIDLEPFFYSVHWYHREVDTYIAQKLLLLDPILQHAEVANIAFRMTATYNDTAFFVQHLPSLLKDQFQQDTKQELGTRLITCHHLF